MAALLTLGIAPGAPALETPILDPSTYRQYQVPWLCEIPSLIPPEGRPAYYYEGDMQLVTTLLNCGNAVDSAPILEKLGREHPELIQDPFYLLLWGLFYYHKGQSKPVYLIQRAVPTLQRAAYEDKKGELLPWTWMLLGSTNDILGMYMEARGYFTLVLDKTAEWDMACLASLSMARSYLREGNYREAYKRFSDLEKGTGPKVSYEASIGKAWTLAMMGDLSSASQIFSSLFGDGPSTWRGEYMDGLLMAGQVWRRVGDPASALFALQYALERQPRGPAAPRCLWEMSEIYWVQEPNEARRLYEKLIVTYPHSVEAQAAIVRLAEMKMAMDGATQDVVSTLTLIAASPGDRWIAFMARMALGRALLATGRYEDAARAFGPAAAMGDAEAGEAAPLLRQAFVKLVEVRDSVAVGRMLFDYSPLIRPDELDVETLRAMARCLIDGLLFDSARRTFENPRVSRKDPDTAAYAVALADARDPKKGTEALERYLIQYEQGAWCADAAVELAEAYMDQGDWNKAEQDLLMGAGSNPTPVQSLRLEMSLGRLCRLTKRPAEAVGHFEKARRILHEIPEKERPATAEAVILYGRADALFEDGRIATAQVGYMGALQSFPDDPLADYARIRIARCSALLNEPGNGAVKAEPARAGDKYWSEVRASYASFLGWLNAAREKVYIQ